MSQFEVYNLLMDLGGKATAIELIKRAKEKYPEYSLHKYIYTRLSTLQKNGIIKKYYNENSELVCEIISEWPY